MICAVEGDIEACAGAITEFEDTELLAPIPNPWMVFSVGMNYGRHLAEMSNTPPPEHPSGFIKNPGIPCWGRGKLLRCRRNAQTGSTMKGVLLRVRA